MKFFRSSSALRTWLENHHDSEPELWIGFYKIDSGKGGITYPEALDEALCFGWIDGVRKRIDEISYQIRFTPRKPRSNWSMVNIKRANELIRLGRMTPPGLAEFEKRDQGHAEKYSYERKVCELDAVCEKRFRANRPAWEYFQTLAPSYQRSAIWWIMSAKKDETRSRRLGLLIDDSAKRQKLAALGGSKHSRSNPRTL